MKTMWSELTVKKAFFYIFSSNALFFIFFSAPAKHLMKPLTLIQRTSVDSAPAHVTLPETHFLRKSFGVAAIDIRRPNTPDSRGTADYIRRTSLKPHSCEQGLNSGAVLHSHTCTAHL